MRNSFLVLPIAAAAVLWAASAPDYSSQLASPDDGRYRAAKQSGLEEAYLPPLFASAHAANLLRLKSGDLLCFWFSGSWEGASDVAIVMSRLAKGSDQWSKPQLVDHRVGESFQNPVPFEAPDGTVWLIHTTQEAEQGQANAKVLVAKSIDHGQTWSGPTMLFDQPGAFVRQPVVVMPNGDWMLPMYFTPSRGITKGAETNYSVVKITSDRGMTWRDCQIPESNGKVQPGVIQFPDGHYIAFFRSRFADNVFRSSSNDGCKWTPPEKTELPNNNSSIQVTRLSNGHLVMAFNNVGSVVSDGKPKAGPRKPLSVALSVNGGETWGWVRDIETGALKRGEVPVEGIGKNEPGREEFSYPSVVQDDDGLLTVAFTYRRFVIKAARFKEDWIKQGSTTGSFKGHSAK